MSDNLLIALQHYASRGNFNPLENFTTEAFTWLLRNEREAEKAFLGLIYSKLVVNSNRAQLIVDTVPGQWKTQEHLKGGIADLIGTFDRFILVIEIKIEAGGDAKQLSKYVASINDKVKDKDQQVFGVFLGKYPWQYQDKNADCEILWEDVYTALETNEEPSNGNIRTFLEYLDFNGLAPARPVTFAGWRYPVEVYQMRNYCRKISEDIGQEMNAKWKQKQFPYEMIYLGFRKERLGRVGIEFGPISNINDKWWIPNVFIGFILDPNDHQLNLVFNEGVLFALVIDVDFHYWQIYDSPQWQYFIKNFEQTAKANRWGFFDRWEERKPVVNKWHPLTVYKPVLRILEEISQNQDRFVRSMNLKSYLEKLTMDLLALLYGTEGFQEILELATELAKNDKLQHR